MAYGMLIDLTKCVGCEACTVNCQTEWQLEPEEQFTKVHRYESGKFPEVKGGVIPTQCFHCHQPPCVEVCPTGASYKRPDGIVAIDEDKCIGCCYCLSACPYGARCFDPTRHIVRKCYFCYPRIEQGKEPACVNTCMAGARVFGDVDDPASAISKAIKETKAVPIRGTSIFYVPSPHLDRSFLPPDLKEPGFVRWWKGVVQPGGKAVMAAAAGAVVVSLAINTSNKGGGTGGDADAQK